MLAIMATYRCVLIGDDGKDKAIREVFAITNAGASAQDSKPLARVRGL